MKVPGCYLASYLVPAMVFLLVGAGCYNPKHDIDTFRPEAEKYLATMRKVGATVKALPTLTQDTMEFPDPKQLRFTDGPGGKQNTAIVDLEEFPDLGGQHIYNRVINEEYYIPAIKLLSPTKNETISAATKETVPYRFHQLLDIKYLLVLRVKHVYTEVTSEKEFKGGEITGEAFLCEVTDPVVNYGGFTFAVRSSNEVTARVSGGSDRRQQEIDRNLAVRADLDDQAVKAVQQKIKRSLPGAGIPSYW